MGGYLADILDKAESDFIKSVLNVVNPKVKHFIILVVVIFYIIIIMAWQQINNRMGLTTSLGGWTQIETRASSGFPELRWFYLSPISPNLLFSTNFEMVNTLFLPIFHKLCTKFYKQCSLCFILFWFVTSRCSPTSSRTSPPAAPICTWTLTRGSSNDNDHDKNGIRDAPMHVACIFINFHPWMGLGCIDLWTLVCY